MPVTWNERPAKSVVYVATIRPSQAPPVHRIEPGDDIKLYAGPIEVFVKVVSSDGDGAYIGRVIGANPHGSTPSVELASGAQVRFLERHIFTCSKHR